MIYFKRKSLVFVPHSRESQRTVSISSPKYHKTQAKHWFLIGCGLDAFLRDLASEGRLEGIMNGIDDTWTTGLISSFNFCYAIFFACAVFNFEFSNLLLHVIVGPHYRIRLSLAGPVFSIFFKIDSHLMKKEAWPKGARSPAWALCIFSFFALHLFRKWNKSCFSTPFDLPEGRPGVIQGS